MKNFPVFIGAAVLIAGCAAGSENSIPEAPSAAKFDEARGAIGGIVTDSNLVPLVGAVVPLAETGLPSALTNREGRFSFSFIEPGPYRVEAEAAGYQGAQQTVDVMAGRVVNVELQLEILPTEDAFHTTSIVQGQLGCSVAVYVRPIDRWQPANLCGIPGIEDEYLVATPIAGLDVARLFTVVFETEWTSTQLLGSGLNVRTSIESDAGASVFNSPFWDMRGRSPLSMFINRTVIEEMGSGTPSFFEKCNPNGTCHFELAAYPWPNTLGAAYPVDVGLNLEQRFTHYVTEFYAAPAPSDFSAMPDR